MSRIAIIFKAVLVMRGPQNFLGGKLFARIIRASPRPVRKWMALRILALSPHYFFAPAAGEHKRMAAGRARLIDDLVAPHISATSVVLDYGCGPGYAAKAASKRAKTLYAVDISDGALEAARTLNGAANIVYLNAADMARVPTGSIDLVYSFALVQHVGNAILGEILAGLHRVLKPDGKMILHVLIDAADGRTEAEWRGDASLAGKMRLRYSLHCFDRSEGEIRDLISAGGFEIREIVPAAGRTAADADIAAQHLVYASRP
jgi:SAM-dependent methyltransferase